MPTARPSATATTPDDFLEDVAWMAQHGESLTMAAARLGVKPASLDRRLMRAGATSLVETLRANEPLRTA